jgi:hypothetical protein
MVCLFALNAGSFSNIVTIMIIIDKLFSPSIFSLKIPISSCYFDFAVIDFLRPGRPVNDILFLKFAKL